MEYKVGQKVYEATYNQLKCGTIEDISEESGIVVKWANMFMSEEYHFDDAEKHLHASIDKALVDFRHQVTGEVVEPVVTDNTEVISRLQAEIELHEQFSNKLMQKLSQLRVDVSDDMRKMQAKLEKVRKGE
jgi:hypothetical protein